jgi:D-amino peptidase
MRSATLPLLLSLLLGALPAAAQKAGPKVYISADMEGIWGVVHGDQTTAASSEYGPARRWMAEDVNAVIQGLLEAGAGEIVVNDAHGSMRNLLPDTLNPKASLVSGSPKPFSMMQGLDASFDAVIFVGYHGRAGSAPAILDHTISGSVIRAIRLNGQEQPEMGLNAALAGHFRVPVVMISGDTETCAQARALLDPGIVTAPVKEAIGRTAARLFPQEEARRRLREGAREALAKRAAIHPTRPAGPFAFEVDFNTSLQAEAPSLLPGVTRTGPRSVSFKAQDYLEGVRLLRAIITLAAS